MRSWAYAAKILIPCVFTVTACNEPSPPETSSVQQPVLQVATPHATPQPKEISDVAVLQECKRALDHAIDATVQEARGDTFDDRMNAYDNMRIAQIERDSARARRSQVAGTMQDDLDLMKAEGEVSRQAFQNIMGLEGTRYRIEQSKALVSFYGDCDSALNAMIHYIEAEQAIPDDQLQAVTHLLFDPRFLQAIEAYDPELRRQFITLTSNHKIGPKQQLRY